MDISFMLSTDGHYTALHDEYMLCFKVASLNSLAVWMFL